ACAPEEPMPVEGRARAKYLPTVDRAARYQAAEVRYRRVARDPRWHARARQVGHARARWAADRVQIARNREVAVHLSGDAVVLTVLAAVGAAGRVVRDARHCVLRRRPLDLEIGEVRVAELREGVVAHEEDALGEAALACDREVPGQEQVVA